MSFPYITQLHVNDCFAYQDFDIPAAPLTEFKHIIITGKNGCGKTTILRNVAKLLAMQKRGVVSFAMNGTTFNVNGIPISGRSDKFQPVELSLANSDNISDNSIILLFKAHRRVEFMDVKSVSTEKQLLEILEEEDNSNKFATQFKQYLVNKKVYEAFDSMNAKTDNVNQNKVFFSALTDILRNVFEDRELELEFVQESFEFYIRLGDGRSITFNELSEGFSAFISILMDLLLRVDIIRKSKGDFTFDPPGIVLIDEPETHFHISMQYEILPMLTSLFPNIQFIVATHSPAVISSIKNAVVFDISSQKEIAGWQAGSSYSELMVNHFGLENEFSPVADDILLKVNNAVQHNDKAGLVQILTENEKYLTPSLKFEIENQIIALESKRA